jgi:hypothetical protein
MLLDDGELLDKHSCVPRRRRDRAMASNNAALGFANQTPPLFGPIGPLMNFHRLYGISVSGYKGCLQGKLCSVLPKVSRPTEVRAERMSRPVPRHSPAASASALMLHMERG